MYGVETYEDEFIVFPVEIIEIIGAIFPSIVCPQDSYMPPCQVLNQSLELLKYVEYLILGLHEIYPSLLGEVINQFHIVQITTQGKKLSSVHKHMNAPDQGSPLIDYH